MTRVHRSSLRMITTSKSQVPHPTSRPPTSDSEEMFGNSGEEEVGEDLPHIRHSHNNSVSPLLFASLRIYKAVSSAISPGLTLIPGLSRAWAYLFFISLQCLVYGNDLNKSKIQWVWTVVRVVSLLAADQPDPVCWNWMILTWTLSSWPFFLIGWYSISRFISDY